MPLFRIDGKLHYFAHVPKCGGSAVESYIAARFGSIGFLNTTFTAVPEAARWSKATPQHITAAEFFRLVPESWIASSFAIVRDPVARFVSAYRYHVRVTGRDPRTCTIDRWLEEWIEGGASNQFMFDGHMLRQCDIIPRGAVIFRLEKGLAPVVRHLDALEGRRSDPREIQSENVSSGLSGDFEGCDRPSEETLARVRAIYAEDYRLLGYARQSALPARPVRERIRALVARLSGKDPAGQP